MTEEDNLWAEPSYGNSFNESQIILLLQAILTEAVEDLTIGYC